MHKNTKIMIFSLVFVVICILFLLCSESIASIISGEDGKCDYCGAKAGIGQDTKEYCVTCFEKYDGNIWR